MSPNRLAGETSPYLLQHRDNPVDWYPWGEEASALARERDLPILLSVGYAACHWCHVMERESFEDEATARLMNEHFVPVKVDREERPDIDGIYMDAVQAMTGSGGWPMTVFLTPDGRPFYAGTYFPKEPRHGMPSFTQVLTAIAEIWDTERNRIEEQASAITRRIAAAATVPPEGGGSIDEALLARADAGIREAFDPEWAGFGGAPKFPPPMVLEYLLARHAKNGDAGLLELVTRTLDRMADGGIHDQVGGGFHRYATDRIWLVPHFEKMLTDNGLLARAYLHAWQVTGRERYRDVTRDTLDYLLREMRHPDGGFWSSQDADAEGVEGRFFVWSWDELVSLVGEPVAIAFGARPEGNWEGANILWTPMPLTVAAERTGVEPQDLARQLDEARGVLLAARDRRVHPATDDKVIAGWNGLAIAALAEAGRVLRVPAYLDAAEAAAGFVLAHLRDADGRLLRSWRDGRGGVPGFADDHGLMAEALLTLYAATGEERWFLEARILAEDLLTHFADAAGPFFQTRDDAEALVVRPKDLSDNAVPSGNAAAASALSLLASFTGEARYETAALDALNPLADAMGRYPTAFGLALSTAEAIISPGPEIAIAGPDGDDRRELTDVVWERYLPRRVLATGEGNAVPLLDGRTPVDGRPAAYVCRRFVCRRPVTTPRDLRRELEAP